MKCLKCNQEKETREFQANEFLTRGYVDNCYDCESDYIHFIMRQNEQNERRANALQLEKDKANEYQKTYRLKNKDKINEKAKQYRLSNKVVKVIDPREVSYSDIINSYREHRRALT